MKTSIEYVVPTKVDFLDLFDELEQGVAYVDYESTLKIGETSIDLDCWVLAGWVEPGAHANIDGSGLQNWGNSQPGFWSVCESDGQQSGVPSVDARGDYDSPIRIGHAKVSSDMIPEWALAVLKVKNAGKDEATTTELPEMDYCVNLRNQIAKQIETAINSAGIPDVDEPSD